MLNAIYGFELIVLSYFIAYTVFPQFRACVHNGINTFVKWSGFTSLCLSLSILMINLLFNQKLNNQIMLNHTFKVADIISYIDEYHSFKCFRPIITSLLIAGFSYKAYLFKVEAVDLILFTSFSVAMLNSILPLKSLFKPSWYSIDSQLFNSNNFISSNLPPGLYLVVT